MTCASRLQRFLYMRFGSLFVLTSLGLLVLTTLLGLAETLNLNARAADAPSIQFLGIFRQSTAALVFLIPLAASIAAAILTHRLEHNGEFTALEAAGLSHRRVFKTLAVAGMMVGFVMAPLLEFWALPVLADIVFERGEEKRDARGKSGLDSEWRTDGVLVAKFEAQVGQASRKVYWLEPGTNPTFMALGEAQFERDAGGGNRVIRALVRQVPAKKLRWGEGNSEKSRGPDEVEPEVDVVRMDDIQADEVPRGLWDLERSTMSPNLNTALGTRLFAQVTRPGSGTTGGRAELSPVSLIWISLLLTGGTGMLTWLASIFAMPQKRGEIAALGVARAAGTGVLFVLVEMIILKLGASQEARAASVALYHLAVVGGVSWWHRD